MSGEVTIEKRSDGSATLRTGEGEDLAEITLTPQQVAGAVRALGSASDVTLTIAS